MSFVGFCDRCTKLATTIIPHWDGEERYCDYHWQARMERLAEEVVEVKVSPSAPLPNRESVVKLS